MNKSYYAIIPSTVRYDKRLCANAKLLYGEVTALCNEKGYCWATNSYFSELYGVSKTSVSKWISSLVELNYLKIMIIFKEGTKEILNRYLTLVIHPIEEKLHTPIEEKLKDNNTVINNTSNNTINKQKHVDEKSTEILDLEVEEVFEEEKKEAEIFLKSKKEKIEKGCAEKEQKEKGEFQQYMDVYHSFFIELNGIAPKIDASDGVALKSLISHCKTLGKDKGSEGLKVFEAIVNASNWKYLNSFTQTQTTIRQINSCFNSIVTQLRNHKQVNKTPNKYIDGLIEANRINQQKIKDGTFNDDPFKDILQYKT